MTPRGPQVELPEPAQARRDELELLRNAAIDAGMAAQGRLNALDEDQGAMRQKLAAEIDKHRRIQNDTHRLLSSINEWWMRLRLGPGQMLAMVEDYASRVELQDETVSIAIENVRREIAANRVRTVAAQRAPIKHGSQREAVIFHLAYLAQRVKPKLNVDRNGRAHVVWAEDLIADKNDLLGLFALICPGETLAMFAIDEKPEAADALSPQERDAKLSELADQLLTLERRECALFAMADGVLPRPDCDPRAYLMVEIIEAATSAAVA
jgi:hypothetical protein